MPRLSPTLYLERHDFLRDIWLHDQGSFGCLSVQEQWDVHRYYQPSVDMSVLQLLEIRKKLDSELPSLGSRVGKLYVQIYGAHLDQIRRLELWERAAALPRPKPVKRKKGVRTTIRQSDRLLSVKAVARPELDIEKLSRALIHIALQRAKAQGEQVAVSAADRAASAFQATRVPGGLTQPSEGVVDGAGVNTKPVPDGSKRQS